MFKHSVKTVGCLIVLFSSQVMADPAIKIDVKTNERTAAAIGFTVDGKKSGSKGKSHSGSGPVNKKYTFGYRKHFAFGPDVLCGTKVLTKNTIVTLITRDEQCSIVIE